MLKAYPKRPYLDDASRVVWRQLVAKMRIALREVKEARVAIRLIVACELAAHEPVAAYEDEARQLALIFAKIIVNTQANMKDRPGF